MPTPEDNSDTISIHIPYNQYRVRAVTTEDVKSDKYLTGKRN